jgi:hypothetical protein
MLRKGRSWVVQSPGWNQVGILGGPSAGHHQSHQDRVAQPEAAQSPGQQRPLSESRPGDRIETWV